jgi:hypothetical protein
MSCNGFRLWQNICNFGGNNQDMKLIFLSVAIITSCIGYSQININKAVKDAQNKTNEVIKNNTGGKKALTNDEVIKGLKEALTIGTNNSSTSASKMDGYFKNPAIKIPFPKDAVKMKNTLESVGMKPQVDKFVLTLNRAAEEAAKEAAPIFIAAITGMSISDGFSILKGSDTAATSYLNDKTNAQLYEKFKPAVQRALQKVEITKYWNPLAVKYNKIPGIKKQNPNLEDYVTRRAMFGLFKLIADEELKIRKDPAARVTDLLKKVFSGL